MLEIGFVNRIALFFPTLKSELRIAHMPYSPVEYINKNLKFTVVSAVVFTIPFFFVLQKAKLSQFLLLPILIVLLILLFGYSLLTVKAQIKKREREIDKEVLFIGRHLLVKLYSGRPLLNGFIEI